MLRFFQFAWSDSICSLNVNDKYKKVYNGKQPRVINNSTFNVGLKLVNVTTAKKELCCGEEQTLMMYASFAYMEE